MIGKACSIHGIMRNSYKSMLRKPDGQRQFWRPRHRFKNKTEIDLREIGFGDMEWFVNGNEILDSTNGGNLLSSWATVTFSRRLLLHGVI
jgi:hypothetical protein